MGSLKGPGFSLDGGSPSDPKWEANFSLYQHISLKWEYIWEQSCGQVCLYSVCSSWSLCVTSCPLFWPQKIWRQEALFNLMPRWFLVVSNTTTERLGDLHPQAREPTISFCTHSGYVFYILYFALFLDVAGQVTHMPSGWFEILFDPQHRTGSQPQPVLSQVPQMEIPFPEHFCSAPIQRQSSREAGLAGAPEPSGGAAPALFSVKQTENKGGEGWGQRLQL